ncbi:hypothetical protein [Acidovorax sp. NCPPB 3576]|uniref:hypothetical protein n=1 Tax=Acidovorax sp. NCPPB 3576 TaxID=2940488 RepID=UPI002349C78B|nr:hypothetical protein [Acidovorax sp. NCPPB 3576]WCM88852.1 hypothetical protein M5C98_02010 [Acidovorax sp. NCPPB 3576]
MTAIVSPPIIDVLPPAPLPTDTPADFNAKGFATVAAQVAFVPQANDLGANAYQNATAANERAVAADVSAATATAQADLAMGYRNTANNAAGTATTQAGLASTARTGAETARTGAEAARDAADSQAGLAGTARTGAETARTGAETARTGAEGARDTALSLAAFAFESTSTTSLTIGLGAKVFAIEAGKSFAVGQYVSAVSTADTSIWMAGPVTAHDRSTGQITLQVNATMGAGTLASWRLVLAANGAAAGVQTIAAGTYTDADLAPLNSVTVITGVNSAYATTHLPVITANSASAGWGTSYDWVVETLGFGAGAGLDATQTAVCSVVGNVLGAGLRFARKKVGTTWGRWKPTGALPSSTLTASGGDMYGNTQLGNNRVNHIATSLNASAGVWYFPELPEDGDRTYFYTNSRTDNAIFYKDKNVIGNGVVLSTSADSVRLNKPFSKFGFAYNLFNDSWMIE